MPGTTILGQRICPACGRISQAVAGDRCPEDGAALLAPDVLDRHPDDPLLGTVLGGKYLLLDLIGAGGFGAVYRAIQDPVGRPVAVKVIRPRADADVEALRGRFFREARALAALNADQTVSLYDYGEDGQLYMAMELVEGPTLSSIMRREGALAAERAVRIALHVLESLAEAHARGIVHRDLKPDNVMLVRGPLGDEKVKVLDFGIAKMKGPAADDFATRDGVVLGTPQYMAPEQARGQAEPRSDLYALGVMLFEMLSGRRPYDGDTPYAVLAAHETTPTPELAAGLVAPALSGVVHRAMSKDPDRRYPDASAMSRALMTVLDPTSQPVTALPPTKVLHDEGRPRRWPLIVGALLIVALAAGVWIWRHGRSGPADPAPDAAPRVTAAAAPADATPGVIPDAMPDAAPVDAAPVDAMPPDATSPAAPPDAARPKRPPRRRARPKPPPPDPLNIFK